MTPTEIAAWINARTTAVITAAAAALEGQIPTGHELVASPPEAPTQLTVRPTSPYPNARTVTISHVQEKIVAPLLGTVDLGAEFVQATIRPIDRRTSIDRDRTFTEKGRCKLLVAFDADLGVRVAQLMANVLSTEPFLHVEWHPSTHDGRNTWEVFANGKRWTQIWKVSSGEGWGTTMGTTEKTLALATSATEANLRYDVMQEQLRRLGALESMQLPFATAERASC